MSTGKVQSDAILLGWMAWQRSSFLKALLLNQRDCTFKPAITKIEAWLLEGKLIVKDFRITVIMRRPGALALLIRQLLGEISPRGNLLQGE